MQEILQVCNFMFTRTNQWLCGLKKRYFYKTFGRRRRGNSKITKYFINLYCFAYFLVYGAKLPIFLKNRYPIF